MKTIIDKGETEARKRHKRALFWDRDPDGIFVTLKPGWAFEDAVSAEHAGRGWGCHVRMFDTVAEAMSGIRAASPCHCTHCTTEGSVAWER